MLDQGIPFIRLNINLICKLLGIPFKHTPMWVVSFYICQQAVLAYWTVTHLIEVLLVRLLFHLPCFSREWTSKAF